MTFAASMRSSPFGMVRRYRFRPGLVEMTPRSSARSVALSASVPAIASPSWAIRRRRMAASRSAPSGLEAEHVSPVDEPQVGQLRVSPQTHAGGDQPAGVLANGQGVEVVERLDTPVQRADALGGLGGVFGDVRGDSLLGEITAHRDAAYVELGAPAEAAAQRLDLRRDDRRRMPSSQCQSVGGRPGRRRRGRAVRTVEADDGVEVDDAPALVLGDLGEGDRRLLAQRLDRQPVEPREATAQRQREAPPQLRADGVEQHRPLVVVAVGAQRLAEPLIVGAVPVGAGHDPPVRAGPGVAASVAGQNLAVLLPPRVDRSKRGSRESHEQARASADRLRHALAADQPGPDELLRVAPVDLGAGRTEQGQPSWGCRRTRWSAERGTDKRAGAGVA
ncbi:hypothetical protein GUY59_07485 [Nonomuraea sp. K271]|nr:MULTISPECIES: hypothetical protein [unclassified Nonomuraea]NBE93044.1 hypothetical protein [Nonomuraea sp. K271]